MAKFCENFVEVFHKLMEFLDQLSGFGGRIYILELRDE
jgi:hypothetical protein